MNGKHKCWVLHGENQFLDNSYAHKNISKVLSEFGINFQSRLDAIDSHTLLELVAKSVLNSNLEKLANFYTNSTFYTVKKGETFNKEQEFQLLFKEYSKSSASNSQLLLAITKILSVCTPDLYIKKLFDLVADNNDKVVLISNSPALKILISLLDYKKSVIWIDKLEDLEVKAQEFNEIFLVNTTIDHLLSVGLPNISVEFSKKIFTVDLTDKFQLLGLKKITPLSPLEIVKPSISDSFLLFHNPLIITGEIVSGKNRGSNLLGIPTANINSTDDYSICIPGVYFGYIELTDISEKKFFTSTSIGYNIHFNDSLRSVESYIHYTFDHQIVGFRVKLELKGYIRSEAAFTSLEHLIETIRNDCNLGNLIDSTGISN